MKDYKKEESKKDTSWGGVSDWYSNYLDTDNDSYHQKVILPNLERLCQIKPDMNVLDLACGEGYFARRWQEIGAKTFAVDISPELISLAKKKSSAKISFHVSPSNDLSFLPDSHFDVVTCVLALQNIEKIKETFFEVSRILKNKGKFLIILNHPSFRIPKRTCWGFDDKDNVQYRRVDSYMSEGKEIIDMNPGGKIKNETISFNRPLQYYSKLLSNNGFVISKIEEWISHKKSEKGKRQIAEDKARKEIPMFMAIETIILK